MQKTAKLALTRAVCLLLGVFLLMPVAATRAEEQKNAMELFVDGVEAFDRNRMSEAHYKIQKAIELRPENPEFRYYLALVYQRMQREDLALDIFRRLVALNPETYRKAFFDIAAIYSRRSQHEKAAETLEQAIRNNPDHARAWLEAGIAHKNAGNLHKAEDYLKKARELNPDLALSVDQVLGVIYLEQEKFDRSEQMFSSVRASAGGTYPEVARAAEKSLEAVQRGRWYRKPWNAFVQFSVGLDDNVVAEPLDPLPNVVYPDREDVFQTLVATGRYRFVNDRKFKLGAGYTFYHLGYQDMHEANLLSHSPSVFTEIRKGPYNARLAYDFVYYYSGGAKRDIHSYGWYLDFGSTDDRLAMHQVSGVFGIDEPMGLHTDVQAIYLNKDYQDRTPNAQAMQVGFIQSWSVFDTGASLRGGYIYYIEDSDAENLDYEYHQGLAGISFPLVWKLRGDMSYTYTYTRYGDNIPPVRHVSRRDRTQNFTGSLTAHMNDMLNLMASYSYTYSDSNWLLPVGNGRMVDIYRYRRNVYTLLLNVSF
ncbi:MAG: tetratricopeptide repeat protein [Desulfatibacillaceae bacterium]